MTLENQINALEKYISGIIIPKYPEINRFSVKLKEGGGEWNFTGQYIPVFQISFFVDTNTKYMKESIFSLLEKIKEDMETLKKFFVISDRKLLIDFRTVVNGTSSSGWYR